MTAASLTLPNFTTQDAAAYKANIDAMAKVYQRIAGAFAAHQVEIGSPQPDMAVAVDAGYILSNGALTEVAAQTVGGFATPSAGQERYDRVVIDAVTGAAARVAGTASTGSPSAGPPAIPAGKLPCCCVRFTETDFVVTNGMITDERVGSSGAAASGAHGSCILSLSGQTLTLSPRSGDKLRVAGTDCSVPSAGVTTTPAALGSPSPISTSYFVYAKATSGVVDGLELSTTGHSIDTTSGNVGIEIKTGDNTRTLVGQVRVNAAGAFVDSVTQRFVRNWFNDLGVSGVSGFSTDRTTASAEFTWAEPNTEIRVEFLAWASELVLAAFDGMMSNATGVSTTNVSIAFDDTTAEEVLARMSSVGAGVGVPIAGQVSLASLSEGYHYATLIACVTAATTATFKGSGTAGQRTTVKVNCNGNRA